MIERVDKLTGDRRTRVQGRLTYLTSIHAAQEMDRQDLGGSGTSCPSPTHRRASLKDLPPFTRRKSPVFP